MSKPVAFRFEWEQALRASALSAKARHIGHLMATYASADGTNIFPGNKRLAEGAAVSARTVSTAVRDLRDGGWVERTRQGNSRNGQTDVYRLRLPSTSHPPAARSGASAARSGASADGSGAGNATLSANLTPSSAGDRTPPDQVSHQAPEQLTKTSRDQIPQASPVPFDAWAYVEQQEAEMKRLMALAPDF